MLQLYWGVKSGELFGFFCFENFGKNSFEPTQDMPWSKLSTDWEKCYWVVQNFKSAAFLMESRELRVRQMSEKAFYILYHHLGRQKCRFIVSIGKKDTTSLNTILTKINYSKWSLHTWVTFPHHKALLFIPSVLQWKAIGCQELENHLWPKRFWMDKRETLEHDFYLRLRTSSKSKKLCWILCTLTHRKEVQQNVNSGDAVW